ncbi:hypothetical protein JCM3765_003043 [Sporobolomyces pararoseus]
MRKFSIQPPFTPPVASSSMNSSSSSTSSQVTFSQPSTSTKHRSKLLSGFKRMLRRRRAEKFFVDKDNNDIPPPLPVDAALTIKRARRQTSPSVEVPKPTPVLTLSSHHLVVLESDRRGLAAHQYPSYLRPIPEYSQTGGGGGDDNDELYTSSSSIASSFASSSSSSLHTLDYSEPIQSRWSDDSSDEFDCPTQVCQCNDLTFTKSTTLCPACTSQDVPEDEGLIESDVDSLLDSYFDEEEVETRERWREFSDSTSTTSSSSSTHYDPLFSPRSSSTSFTVSSPRLYKSRPETPVDIRDFDMILTSVPPSPHGVRFNRASIDARDALIAESRRKRVSTGTI